MKRRNPRHGSMQFWPRVRAARSYASVRTWAPGTGMLGFAGYKAGMTHLIVTDNRTTTKTKGTDIFCPATVVECPPLKVAGIRFYKIVSSSMVPFTQVLSETLDKELGRKIPRKFDAIRPGDQPIYISDNSLIKKELGWEPEISAKKGLKQLVGWVRENQDEIKQVLE